jgi:hypothetical protein
VAPYNEEGIVRTLPLVGLSILGAVASAQEPPFAPSYNTPAGRELVVVFISSASCVANTTPGFLEAIDPMNRALARQAEEQNLPFVAVGVTTDWSPDSGYAYLKRLSSFNEMIVGRNWYNLGAAVYIWADSTNRPMEPQVILLERDVVPGPTAVQISPDRVLRRFFGAKDIMDWVSEGAPIPKLQPN